MTDTTTKTGLALLREPFPAHQVSKLPKGGVKLAYAGENGAFVWVVDVGRWGRIKAGSHAGSPSHGYITIVLDGVRYPAHRLAWLFTYGSWPTGEIDHINGRRDDNRIENLRDVPKRLNGHNRHGPNRDNKSSGLLGVTRNGKNGWMAQITVDGERRYLGTFKDPEIAHAVYVSAKRKMHEGCTI